MIDLKYFNFNFSKVLQAAFYLINQHHKTIKQTEFFYCLPSLNGVFKFIKFIAKHARGRLKTQKKKAILVKSILELNFGIANSKINISK